MTMNGWIQIALYCAIIIAITKPLGGYMTRVFNGERTFLSPLLRPVERAALRDLRRGREGRPALADLCHRHAGVQRGGFLSGFTRCSGCRRYCPSILRSMPAVGEHLAFNTSVSFITNTNWQSYVPETTMSYLVQMAGLTVHNFVSAATGIALAVALIRGFARRSAQGDRQFLGRSDPLHALHPAADLHRRRPVLRLAGHAAESATPTPTPRRWKAPSRPSRRVRWLRRKSSRCWAPTAAASSTPIPRIRSKIPTRSPIWSR